MTRVADLLHTQYPIIQGAMGIICNPELVAAVSEAGGFGLLATIFASDPETVRKQVQATKKLTDQPFGANLFAGNPLAPQFAEVLAEEGIKAVTVSGGSPKELIPLSHQLGIKVLVVVPTVDMARKSEAAGADAIVAEGSESGGMQGFRGASTMVLVPAVADAVKIPVIAAGGIGDSRGYLAALALGAEGVQVGTRFIATKECVAHPHFKETIVGSPETGTELVNLGRFRVRALGTPLVEKIVQGEMSAAEHFSGSAVQESWIGGDLAAGILPSGQVSGLISSIPSVREVIEEMVSSNRT
jgi:enoyl-[acyl-carrier protein] reductase II